MHSGILVYIVLVGKYLGCCPLPLFKVLKLHLKKCHSSFVSSNIKRRDFTFNDLVNQEYMKDEGSLFSDLGDEAEIFSPIKEYPLINFRRIYEQSE